MKRVIATMLVATAVVAIALVAGRAEAAPAKQQDVTITGTGATFPFPLISKWIPELGKAYGINFVVLARPAPGPGSRRSRLARSTSGHPTRP